MSLFDFLANPNLTQAPDYSAGMPAPQGAVPQMPQATPAAPQGLLAPAAPPEELEDTPHAGPAEPQGLLGRFSAPDPTGVSMADRIYAIGSILKGDSTGGMKYLTDKAAAASKAKATQAASDLADKGNRAFRAAYQGGKFDPSTYAAMMGGDLDPEAFAKLATAAGPKGSMSGPFAISTNPLGGDISIQGVRPPDYADNTAAGHLTEDERHNAATEAQGGEHVAIAKGNAALAQLREKRIAAKAAGGGADWTHRVIGVGKVQ